MQSPERIITDTQTRWVIDPTHTTVEFAIKNLFFFTVKGNLTALEGAMVLDAADVHRSSVSAVLKSASIDTGNKQRDAHLRSRDYLETDRYPDIRFQSTRVEAGSDRDTLRVTGSLTIRDKSREIVLEVSEVDQSRSPSGEHVMYYSARTELDRLDFGIDHMRPLIGRRLSIAINVEASRRP